MSKANLHGKRVLLVGLGHFGGQIAAARWLIGQGARVLVTDHAPAEKLKESLAQIADLPLEYRLGGHDERDLDGADLLVVSPAVPRDRSTFVQAALARGIPLSSEMNLFVERCPARRIIGVTGSAGKSTTTAMIGALLGAAAAAGAIPRGRMGGNIGRSLLNDLGEIGADEVIVLELSSFQLDDLAALRWSPPVAVVTNLQPNHLDRHGTMEAYASAKMYMVRFQSPADVVIIHDGDAAVARAVTEAGAGARMRTCRFDPVFADSLHTPGAHNLLNAAAAIAAVRASGIDDKYIAQGLAAFRGLEHRLEYVGEIDGIRYYNDSKSTTPESTRIAVESFPGEPVIVLVGGSDKGMPFDELGRFLAGCCRGVVCYGAVGLKIYSEVMAGIAAGGAAQGLRAKSFAQAVQSARAMARRGDVVLLSPATASYDEFSHYEQRGEAFRSLVCGPH